MKSIKFTDDGDIAITSKRLDLVEDLPQKMQKTRGILLTSLGELFFNTEIGLDRTEVLDIKEKNISEERKRLAVITATMQDENVEKVEVANITTDIQNRSQVIDMQLKYKDEEDITELGGVAIG